MDEELIGYLLNALDPQEMQAVERYLETAPEGRRRLERFRAALAPLAEDKSTEPPPPELVFKTLRKAGLTPAKLPFGRRRSAGFDAPSRGAWRRADVFIAASIALIVLMLLPPGLIYLRQREDIVRCSENLRGFGVAFAGYAADHNGRLPQPEQDGPLAAAGIYAPALRDAGYLKGSLRIYCPRLDTGLPQLVPTLDQLRTMEESPQYHLVRKSMGGSYAFNLGYRDDNKQFQPIRKELGDEVPVLADRPPRPSERAFYQLANSPNHGFRGQNVLFQGGHVRFLTGRTFAGDDLFLSRFNNIAAGWGPTDAVLAPSEFPPFPQDGELDF